MSDYENQRTSGQLFGESGGYIEGLYEDYLIDPTSVSETWQRYFQSIRGTGQESSRLAVQERFEALAQMAPSAGPASSADISQLEKQVAVLNLISAYRIRGHQAANLCPINLRERKDVPDLDPEFHGLERSDMETEFFGGTLFINGKKKLREIIDHLQRSYTDKVGAEIMHIHNTEERRWLQEQLERAVNGYVHGNERKKQLLKDLVAADGLEKFLHNKYVGQKRFSLEGGDGLIPLMDALIQRLGKNGTKEIGIAMAHRGRLNMLINILGKRPADLFDEFEGRAKLASGSGDVKYHMGFSSAVDTEGGAVDLSLAYNPSHLEFVNAVVQGSTRARLDRVKVAEDATKITEISNHAVAIQIHGDAAFTGQGIIQETLQLSQVRGYRTGGSVHIIINNQIGFTTSNLLDARSSMYCSDAAKIIQAPVLHVNGDDPEAIVFVAELAAEYIRGFHKDIVIDLVCYRRLGHNEADEPAATQPMMYKKIRAHAVPAKVYEEKLIGEALIDANYYGGLVEDYRQRLEAGETVARPRPITEEDPLAKAWKALRHQDWDATVNTSYPADRLTALGQLIFSVPEGFKLHPIVAKLYETRRQMSAGQQELDWGCAENLAYASLLQQGYAVRVSGEDCGRGTFSHRHAVVHNQDNGESYMPLAHIADKQPPVRIIDSILSENAVLGFEYGYSIAEPHGLVIWEAQFGDFANGAQVIIDQFIASGESKWGRYSGLVMLLPHGYEGQGPEHSSARLERYLQLSADHNWQVCVPTTAAQVFHMLRRQVLREFRKPLVVMSPKSLLRHKLAAVPLSALAEGSFQQVIGEIDPLDKAKVNRIVLCSGKIYYDLLQQRREANLENVAIIRLEQLYPFPVKQLREQLALYNREAQLVWCQEEPRNQGAWRQIREWLDETLGPRPISYAGRLESASTAAGYAKVHSDEQAAVVRQALGL